MPESTRDSDAQNAAKNAMDDFFYDVVKEVHGIDLSSEQMDEMIGQTMRIAKFTSAGNIA